MRSVKLGTKPVTENQSIFRALVHYKENMSKGSRKQLLPTLIQKDNKVAFIVWIFDALGSPLSKKCSFKTLFHMSDVNNLMPFLRHYIEDDTVVLKK